jgi:hypothetical protein
MTDTLTPFQFSLLYLAVIAVTFGPLLWLHWRRSARSASCQLAAARSASCQLAAVRSARRA